MRSLSSKAPSRRWLIVVADDQPTVRQGLRLAFADDPTVEVVHVEERPGQVDRHIGSTDKLAGLTGWRASTSFAEGLERTITWYRDNEAWWRGILGRDRVSSS